MVSQALFKHPDNTQQPCSPPRVPGLVGRQSFTQRGTQNFDTSKEEAVNLGRTIEASVVDCVTVCQHLFVLPGRLLFSPLIQIKLSVKLSFVSGIYKVTHSIAVLKFYSNVSLPHISPLTLSHISPNFWGVILGSKVKDNRGQSSGDGLSSRCGIWVVIMKHWDLGTNSCWAALRIDQWCWAESSDKEM